jgi:hypothetical protein
MEYGVRIVRALNNCLNKVSCAKTITVVCLIVKIGTRVKLRKDRLQAQYLPENVNCSYAKVTIDDRLAGNVFACRWKVDDKTVCWVTQLVVHADYRERGLAVSLLNFLRQDDDDIYGIMSSHPAACLAAAKAFGSKVPSPPLL